MRFLAPLGFVVAWIYAMGYAFHSYFVLMKATYGRHSFEWPWWHAPTGLLLTLVALGGGVAGFVALVHWVIDGTESDE